MAWDHHNLVSPILPIRSGTGELIASPTTGGVIRNMVTTEAGTLRAVVGPVQYHPTSWVNTGGGSPTPRPKPAPHYGIFHTLLEGGKRDVLLVHDSEGVKVHNGWAVDWDVLIKSAGAGDIVLEMAEMDGRVGFPTQFVAAPNGVVIIVQGERSYFYDGTTIAPLGFSEVPGAPGSYGPKPTTGLDNQPGGVDEEETVGGYYKIGRSMNSVMGNSRIGSIRNDTMNVPEDGVAKKRGNPIGGTRMEGSWNARLQFIDHWGNRSAWSATSAPAIVGKEDNLTKDRKKDLDESSSALRIQLAWTDLDPGPEHCVARDISRTKDQINSGRPGHYWLPPNAKGDSQTLATLHTREQRMFPDNVPDEWLIDKVVETVPVPVFRLATMAFGRMWIGNMLDTPGMIRPSEPFFWGTFPANQEIYPDANGAEVTGLLAVNSGLLVFTETSTFLVTQDDSGQNFKTATLSTTSGCVAPNSCAVMQDGLAVWLGREGFYAWSGSGVPTLVSKPVKDTHTYRINKGWRRGAVAAVDPRMGEYRCWVPVDGSQVNNLCMVFDGGGWRERNDVYAAGVCVTRDHRQYMLALGTATDISDHSSVWTLDHDGRGDNSYTNTRESWVETTWLRNTRSHRRGSPIRAGIWIRESTSGNLTVEVMRDWREYPKLTEVGTNPPNYPEDDTPPFWDTVLVGSTTDDVLRDLTGADANPSHFVRRRPHWVKVDIMLPSVEVFRIRVKYTGDWEFIGIHFDEQDRHAGGAKIPEGA